MKERRWQTAGSRPTPVSTDAQRPTKMNKCATGVQHGVITEKNLAKKNQCRIIQKSWRKQAGREGEKK